MSWSIFKLMLLGGIFSTLFLIILTCSIYFPMLNQSYTLRKSFVGQSSNSAGELLSENGLITTDSNVTRNASQKASTTEEVSKQNDTKERDEIIKKETEAIISRRNEILKAACENSGQKFNDGNLSTNTWKNEALTNKPRLYYSDEYKIVMCAVPKCGSTEWRKAFLIMEKIVDTTSPDDIEHEAAFQLAWKNRGLWKKFDFRTTKGKEEIERRLNSYYRIMTVREPLERLVSAYIDKMLPGGSGEGVYSHLSRNIHRAIGNHSKDNMDRATFSEFLTHVLRQFPKGMLDIHWRPYRQVCDPCRMNYHHIAKLEAITRDADYISKLLGIKRSLIFPGNITDVDKEQHKWKAKYAKYYEDIPKKTIKDIYKIYEQDYKLYGYNPPPFYED